MIVLHDSHVLEAYRRDYVLRRWNQRKENRKVPLHQRRDDAEKLWALADELDEVLALPQAVTAKDLRDRRQWTSELEAQIKSPINDTQPQTRKPVGKISAVDTPERKDERYYRACVDAGLTMPTEPLKPMPRGISKVAKQLGIKRQSLTESVEKHIDRLHEAAQRQAIGR